MARAILLALLLVFALPMGAAAAPGGGTEAVATVPSLQEIAILTLNDTSRPGFTSPSLDVASAMAVQRDAAATELARYGLGERFAEAPSDAARRALLLEAATAVEIRIVELRNDRRALRAAYVNREVDAETFVRHLVLIHARADRLLARLDRIEALSNDLPQFSMRGRIQLLRSKLIGFQGPVRGHALAATLGQTAPTRMAVIVSPDGEVLSMLGNGRYIRTAYRADQRTPDSVSNFTIDEAEIRANFELYPEAYNRSQQVGYGSGINGLIGGNIYLVQFAMPAGSLSTYLDDGTQNVFFEVQERRLDLLGPRPSVVGAANGTRLTVNRTYSGGPLQLSVVNNETGEPLQTTVVVGGNRVETGPDGAAWTLAPAGAFRVTAVRPRGNVTVTVRPLIPTAVHDG